MNSSISSFSIYATDSKEYSSSSSTTLSNAIISLDSSTTSSFSKHSKSYNFKQLINLQCSYSSASSLLLQSIL